MKRANVLGAALVVAGLVATAVPAAAQVTVGADLGLFSDYVWRGITYTNKFVLQPDVYLTFPAGTASITVGGWANIEPGKYDGDDGHQRERRRVELRRGRVRLVGRGELSRIRRPHFTARRHRLLSSPTTPASPRTPTRSRSTARSAFDVPLSPKLAVWYDVDKIKGAYFEGSISPHASSRRTRSSPSCWARSPGSTPGRDSGRPDLGRVVQLRRRRLHPPRPLRRRAVHRGAALDHAGRARRHHRATTPPSSPSSTNTGS